MTKVDISILDKLCVKKKNPFKKMLSLGESFRYSLSQSFVPPVCCLSLTIEAPFDETLSEAVAVC